MRLSVSMRRLMILSWIWLFTACGQAPAPIALTKVTPTTGAPAPEEKTLLQAVTENGVPMKMAIAAFGKFDRFSSFVENAAYMTMVDFTQASGKYRMYIVNTKTGEVDALVAAHGEGSDPQDTGTAKYFSNENNSHMTSLGAYIVNEKFQSTYHGTAMRMDGLETTNSLARARGILVHSADYVREGNIKQKMSWGCVAVSLNAIDRVLKRLADGTFLYAYGLTAARTNAVDAYQIQQMMLNPAQRWTDEGEEAPIGGSTGLNSQ
jgi:hypothetical protein